MENTKKKERISYEKQNFNRIIFNHYFNGKCINGFL